MSVISRARNRLSVIGAKLSGSHSREASSVATPKPAATSAPAAAPIETPAVPSPIDYTPEARCLSGPKTTLRQLYPPIQPFEEGFLDADETHKVFYQRWGNKDGKPVVYLHGGPGGGTTRDDARWFDPSHYNILTFDQRGSGKSTPAASLDNNTTWDLVADIERLRTKFGFEKWHVFGGSWGSTLSLAYAQAHPQRVSALILRGIFTLRKSELLFFYQNGASHLFPEFWEPYLNHIPEEERGDLMKAYYKRLTGEDEKERLAAAKRWSTWENSTSRLYVDAAHIAKGDDDLWALQFARIENHFFVNEGWMKDGQLLFPENIAKIRHIPTVIVQGRYDSVCPATTAYSLLRVWNDDAVFKDGAAPAEAAGTTPAPRKAEFHLLPDCGHSAKEPGIMDRLVRATDKFKDL